MVTKEFLSYSFASTLLNKSFDQIRYDMANPTPPTPKMESGSRMEYVLKHGLDCMEVWTKTKTKGKEFTAHLEALKGEIELFEEHPYLLVTESEYDACEMMMNHLREEVRLIIDGAEWQSYKKGSVNGYDTHAYCDFLLPDCVLECKFTNSEPLAFAKQVINMNWHLQLYVYKELFDRDVRWIVINDKPPYLVTIYNVPDDRFYNAGKIQFEKASHLFDKFNLGMKSSTFNVLECPQWV